MLFAIRVCCTVIEVAVHKDILFPTFSVSYFGLALDLGEYIRFKLFQTS